MNAPLYPMVGASLMPEGDFALAAFPLFDEGLIEVAEWSFDTCWHGHEAPPWLEALVGAYSDAGRLLGHGVSFSIFTADEEHRSEQWLAEMAREHQRRNYAQVSEHFGFMLAGDFHRGAPLPMPYTPETLRLGRDRLRRLSDVAQVPVGLENLAFAFGLQDVRGQGSFLEELLEPVDGFLLLDLHNIYCQACNFEMDPVELLRAYPLARVRELHVSGGSWSESVGAMVRRDAHDGPVPREVFALLQTALQLCPGTRAVILEHLGTALGNELARAAYREDFQYMRQIVHGSRTQSAAVAPAARVAEAAGFAH